MTQFSPGLIIEILLMLLLVVTVGYCLVLNRRLGRLRSAQDELRQIIHELGTATQTAEQAIRGLKITTEEADAKLTEKLHKAQLVTRQLSAITERGGALDEPVPERPVRQPETAGETEQPGLDEWRRIVLSRLKKAG